MLAALDLIGGIAFDPTIRGWLVVLTGVAILMGSVWLILSTNSGVRMGTLLALTGFFGWMAIMGFTWWLYGIGWNGRITHLGSDRCRRRRPGDLVARRGP